MSDEGRSPWDIIKDATGVDYLENARRAERENNDLPKGCWIFMGCILALGLVVGGVILLINSLAGNYPAGNIFGEVVVSIAMIAAGVLLFIPITKPLR